VAASARRDFKLARALQSGLPIMNKTDCFGFLTTILAIAASACSAPQTRAVATADATVECAGGTVQSEADAARYAGCEAVVGDLRIAQSNLTDVSAFKSLRSVSGRLVVADNKRLISLAGLKRVERAGSVEIRNNPVLAGFPGLLPELQQVDEQLVLRANRGLSAREVRDVLERVEVRTEHVTINEATSRNRIN
jgi:hypothetical protein